MSDIFLLKAIAKTLILPPTGLLLAIFFGLLLVQRFPRTGRAISIIATVYLLALSTPFASYQLMHFLETSPPLDIKEARHAQAIVILGGGIRNNALEYGGDTVGRLTLDRVRYGARVAKQTGLPVLVAGGSVLSGEPEAKLMRETMENEFGVKVRWSEDKSRNTNENARFSAAMLEKENIQHVVLVTHSFDMPRAKAEFTAAGLQVIAAPTGILNGDLQWPSDYLPGMGGLLASYYVCYELLAMFVMRASLVQ